MWNRVRILLLLISIVFVCSCKSEYTKLVESEREKGQVYKELPLGLSMGITKKKYFSECWQLNSKKMISQGSGNQFAKYELIPFGVTDSLMKINMLFYGMFDDNDVMHGMDMIMEFNAWSPWNKDFHSPALISTLENHYLYEYKGNPFISIQVTDDLEARVKVDGNRRITIYPLSSQKVSVKIIDLNYENELVK